MEHNANFHFEENSSNGLLLNLCFLVQLSFFVFTKPRNIEISKLGSNSLEHMKHNGHSNFPSL